MRFIEDRISVICNELKELAFVKKEPVKELFIRRDYIFTLMKQISQQNHGKSLTARLCIGMDRMNIIGSEQNILFRRVWMEKLFISRWQHR